MELVQVRLVVSNFTACFRFYRDVMGLCPQVDDERGPDAKLSPVGGGCAVALHARADLKAALPSLREPVGSESDQSVLAFKVGDLDAFVAEIAERGATVLQPPAVQWGRLRVAYIRDPEGHLIELQQWLTAR